VERETGDTKGSQIVHMLNDLFLVKCDTEIKLNNFAIWRYITGGLFQGFTQTRAKRCKARQNPAKSHKALQCPAKLCKVQQTTRIHTYPRMVCRTLCVVYWTLQQLCKTLQELAEVCVALRGSLK